MKHLILIAAFFALPAYADLAVTCSDATKVNQDLAACKTIVYKTATLEDLVRDCGTDKICWTAGDTWKKLKDVPAGSSYDTCKDPQLPSPTVVGTTEPCKGWATVAVISTNASGDFELSWEAPTLNTDGSALKDLAGFWIYSSAQGATLGKLLQVKDVAARKTMLTGYGPGTYTFGVAAYNAAGGESSITSAPSVEVVGKKTPGAVTGVSIRRVELTGP